MEQYGFRVILPVVGGGDPFRPHVLRGGFKEGIAQRPGRVLDAKPLPAGKRPGVPPPAGQGDALALAPRPDECLVPVRRRPQPVVEMGGSNLEPGFPGQPGQNMQQRHGIPSAGDGAQHGPALGQHVEPFTVCPNPAGQTVSPPHQTAFPRC